MPDRIYTFASWYLKVGQEEAFLQIWRDELAAAFLRSNTSAQGTLIRSLKDPRQFYSFGPWETLEQMQTARSDPHVRNAVNKLIPLCDEVKPGPFRIVLTIP